MRKDMARLIVKGPPVPKDRSNHTKSRLDFEEAPEREGMRERHGWREGPRDHLNPLRNYLRSNVGRPWAEVFSEICAVTDLRNFAGKHLREHIDMEVISETELAAKLSKRYAWYYVHFYYDSNGILREFKKRYPKYSPARNPDECEILGVPYVRINNCWFEAKYVQVTECRYEYDWRTQERVNKYYPKRVTRHVRQLNTKELKTLGLSNEPGWKWYERAK